MPYKNVDVAIEAVRGRPERLVVVGHGPLSNQLQAGAPANVRMLSDLSDAALRWTYAHARILLAPSLEDFGLTPLEAATFGVPTLALRGGGYLDTIDEHVNGAFFAEPDRRRPAERDGRLERALVGPGRDPGAGRRLLRGALSRPDPRRGQPPAGDGIVGSCA